MRSQVNRTLYWDISHTCDFFYRNAFLIMKLSNAISFRAIRALLLHNRRLKYKLLTFNSLFLTFLLCFVSHFTNPGLVQD